MIGKRWHPQDIGWPRLEDPLVEVVLHLVELDPSHVQALLKDLEPFFCCQSLCSWILPLQRCSSWTPNASTIEVSKPFMYATQGVGNRIISGGVQNRFWEGFYGMLSPPLSFPPLCFSLTDQIYPKNLLGLFFGDSLQRLKQPENRRINPENGQFSLFYRAFLRLFQITRKLQYLLMLKYTPARNYCKINSDNLISCNWNEIFQENNSQNACPCNSLNHKRTRDM